MSEPSLAIDIGASSGRHILGWVENGRIVTEEVYRFPNGSFEKDGHLYWDADALLNHVLSGMSKCRGRSVRTVGVDTWGVDYALIGEDGQRLGDCAAYRDGRTAGMDERLERTLPFAELYARTGIAKQPFNTVYQLMSEPPERLRAARRCLFTPDYLHYRLTGRMANEYTIASTSGLLNARTKRWDAETLAAAGIPAHLFPEEPIAPGALLGPLLPECADRVGYSCQVALPASHDTGSAYLAVPAKSANAVYLSSGTWSLLGVELTEPVLTEGARQARFTNEGSYGGSIRFLQNIMGLWMLQQIRHEWNDRLSFAEMADLAAGAADFAATVDVTDNRFLAPQSMAREVCAALTEAGAPVPASDAQLLACVTRSLAAGYAKAIRELEALTHRRFDCIHVVGGGSNNRVLNQWTADASGLPVHAGPGEGTALGNLMAQLIARGIFADAAEARQALRESVPLTVYLPAR